MKNCSVCGLELPMSEFSKDKKSKDGHVSRCKPCTKEYASTYYKKNSPKLKDNNLQYKNDNRDAVREKDAAYRAANRDKINAKKRQAYKESKNG